MQFDWWTFALQTVNFLIVIWLLTRFLYRPVRRVIEAREAATAAARQEAEQKAAEAEKMREAYEKRRAALEAEAQQRAAKLHAAAEAEREAMLRAAREEAEQITAAARDRIARERTEALAALRQEIVTLAAQMARRALSEPLPDAGEVARQLDEMPKDQLADLRADLDSGAGGVNVVSAQPLKAAERARWEKMLRARFGKALKIEFSTDAALIAGAELRFPHAVLSFSLADRLNRIAAMMEEEQ